MSNEIFADIGDSGAGELASSFSVETEKTDLELIGELMDLLRRLGDSEDIREAIAAAASIKNSIEQGKVMNLLQRTEVRTHIAELKINCLASDLL